MPDEKNLKFVETGKGKVYYFFHAVPAARGTAVFLHGLSANHTTWIGVLEKFQSLGLNCLLWDMRGHGHSDKAKHREYYRLPVFAEDLEAIVKQEGLEQIILVGYSSGGMVALKYAELFPASLAALVLISTNYVSPLNYRHFGFFNPLLYGFLNGLAWLLIWQKRRQYYYFNQADLGVIPGLAGYWDATFRGLMTMPLSVNLWMLSEGFRLNLSGALGKITCPCLILRAKHDPFITEKEALQMHQVIKNSKLVVLNESSHFLGTDHQQKTVEIIMEFLNEKLPE